MDTAVMVVQIVLALVILNVWLLRAGRETEFRGGDAKNMKEEFAVYGLPIWFMAVVAALKVTCAILLVVGLWVPVVTQPAAIGLGVLMLGAVAMHLKVKDSVKKTLPATVMLILCVFVAVTRL